MKKILELTLECSMCDGDMTVKIVENEPPRDLFKPCPACRVLATIVI